MILTSCLAIVTVSSLLQGAADGVVRGVLTPWDAWSPCDVTCGGGIKTRYRACYPLNAVCNGTTVDTKKCSMKTCPDIGKWGEWSAWAPCTKSCGIGIQTRTRLCLSKSGVCTGGNQNVKICNPQPCTATGGWSAWTEWSTCSAECGPGVRYQDRTCEDPSPSNGGPHCRGPGTRVGHCFETLCLEKTSNVGVFSGTSFLLYDRTFLLKKLLSIYIKFLPSEQDGLLFYRHHGNDTSTTKNDTVILRLEGARVQLYVQLGNIMAWITDDRALEMKKWHDALVSIVGARVTLRVDNGFPVEQMFPNLDMDIVDLDQHMFVGSVSPAFMTKTEMSYAGFIGHIAALRVNYEDYFLEEHSDYSVNEEANHPVFSSDVAVSDIDSNGLYPVFGGSDYTAFICPDCNGKLDIKIELLLKPFQMHAALLLANFGEEPGSFIVLYFRKNTLIFCINLGTKKRCASTETLPENQWLALNFTMSGVQAKLRLNHERAYILASDGRPYKATPVIHFAGGEGELWTTIYMITRLIRGFEGMLFRVTINNEKFNVRKEVTLRETGSLVSSMAASIAGKYDEFHEPPVSDVDFLCDISAHEELMVSRRGQVYWLREGEIIQNFTGIDILKVPGMSRAVKMSLRSTEIAEKDGFYGCLLRTDTRDVLMHVFGVSFDYTNEVDVLDVAESIVWLIVLIICICLLIAIGILLRFGLLRRFPTFNAIIERLPSWFTLGQQKNFLKRHAVSLQRSGMLSPDEIHKILALQEKAIQTSKSNMDTFNQISPTIYDTPLSGAGEVKRRTVSDFTGKHRDAPGPDNQNSFRRSSQANNRSSYVVESRRSIDHQKGQSAKISRGLHENQSEFLTEVPTTGFQRKISTSNRRSLLDDTWKPTQSKPSTHDDPTDLLSYDPNSDYDQPVDRKLSDGTFFPPPITDAYRRSRISMRIPNHIRKNPDAFMPSAKTSWRNSFKLGVKNTTVTKDTSESADTKSHDTATTESFTVTPTDSESKEFQTVIGSPTADSSSRPSKVDKVTKKSQTSLDQNDSTDNAQPAAAPIIGGIYGGFPSQIPVWNATQMITSPYGSPQSYAGGNTEFHPTVPPVGTFPFRSSGPSSQYPEGYPGATTQQPYGPMPAMISPRNYGADQLGPTPAAYGASTQMPPWRLPIHPHQGPYPPPQEFGPSGYPQYPTGYYG